MVIQRVDGEEDHLDEQYEMWMRWAHPIFNPVSVVYDTYAEFKEIENRFDDRLHLSWDPRDPGKELAAAGEVELRHLNITMPMSKIDETMNGAVNIGDLMSLVVNDPNDQTPEPVRFIPEWTSQLRVLRLFSGIADAEFMQSLEELELADIRGHVFDARSLPANIKYVSAEDADVKSAGALTDLPNLKALRVVVCRGVPDLEKLPLPELQSLESLVLEGFSKTESLNVLSEMPNLRTLGLGGFSKVADLSALLDLPNLEVLQLRAPGMRGLEKGYQQLVPLLERSNFRWLVGPRRQDLGQMPESSESKLAEHWSDVLKWPLADHYHR